MLFRTITEDQAKPEKYPFNVFRFPSLGMLACPADVPAEIYGQHLCFSLGNNLPLFQWGIPELNLKSAVIDFTNADYNMLRIRAALHRYYKTLAQETKMEKPVVAPDIFSFEGETPRGEIEKENHADFLQYLEKLIEENGYRFIYLHGLSGYYDKCFYDCVSKIKRMTVKHESCMVISHVIASVIYNFDSSNNESSMNVMRGPLSHTMIRPSHLEASAVMDWTWFIAPTTLNIIKRISQSDIVNGSQQSQAQYFANKIVCPNRYLSLGKSELGNRCPAQGLFYTFKNTSPIIFPVELTGSIN